MKIAWYMPQGGALAGNHYLGLVGSGVIACLGVFGAGDAHAQERDGGLRGERARWAVGALVAERAMSDGRMSGWGNLPGASVSGPRGDIAYGLALEGRVSRPVWLFARMYALSMPNPYPEERQGVVKKVLGNDAFAWSVGTRIVLNPSNTIQVATRLETAAEFQAAKDETHAQTTTTEAGIELGGQVAENIGVWLGAGLVRANVAFTSDDSYWSVQAGPTPELGVRYLF